MDITAYLQRINYRGSLAPSAQTLRELQLAHLFAVPFENLSIHSAEPIVLNDDALFEKIVLRRRGGFCYELNGLFAALLRQLGFEVTMLSAGVNNSEGVFGPDFDHMTLLVVPSEDSEERWLADWLDRLDPAARQLAHRDQASADLPPVEADRAGAAVARIAADLGPDEAEVVTQSCGKTRDGRAVPFGRPPVQGEGDLHARPRSRRRNSVTTASLR